MPNIKLISASGETVVYSGITNIKMTDTDNNPVVFEVAYTTYSVSYALDEHSSSSNISETINSNETYTTTISASSGYKIDTIVVTMSGKDITSSVLANDTITIANPTGPIIITTTSSEKHEYTYNCELLGGYFYIVGGIEKGISTGDTVIVSAGGNE